jgi:hypothetical protein
VQLLVSVFPYDEAAKLCGGALPSSALLFDEFVFLVLITRSTNIVNSSCIFGLLLICTSPFLIPFQKIQKYSVGSIQLLFNLDISVVSKI